MAAQEDAARASQGDDTVAMPPENVCKFKLVIVGNSNVGKTSLVVRFVEKRFCSKHKYTVGATFATQKVIVGNTTVKFDIWDTAGQERFQSLTPLYYRGAQAAIVVYDITDKESYRAAKSMWVDEVRKHASPNITISLAGNKADLLDQREVKTEEAQVYADENDFMFMETSAKTDMNIDYVFVALAKKLLNSGPGHEQPDDSQEPYVSGYRQSKSGSCCKK